MALLALSLVPALADPGNEATVRAAIDQMLGAGRLDLAETLHNRGFAFLGEDRRNPRDELSDNVRTLRQALPDLRATVDRIIARGALVAVQRSGAGTNSVRIGPLAATRRSANWSAQVQRQMFGRQALQQACRAR